MASAEDCPLVVVTGASGYLAKQIILQLLEGGEHRVRGTVRSLENEAKVKPLQELCPEAKFKLELVEADLTNADCWENAIKDATYVIHTASPYPLVPPENPDDLIKPAVEGTTNVLKAAQKAKVQRVVLTSSVAAVCLNQDAGGEKTYTEEDWAPQEKAEPYFKSKYQAEKAAWDFVKELPEEEKFELVVINPCFIQGPVLSGNADFTSVEFMKQLLERAMPMVPKICLNICDVRDVAEAHIKGMTVAEAAGHRHIIYSGSMWMKEVAQVLGKEFKSRGYNPPTMGAPYALLWMRGLFDKKTKAVLSIVGKSQKLDNSRMVNVLGIQPREVTETLLEMAYSLIEQGVVKKSKKYRARGEEEPKPETKTDKAEAANGALPKEGEDKKEEEADKEGGGKKEGEQEEKKEDGEKKEETTEENKEEEKKEGETQEEEKKEEEKEKEDEKKDSEKEEQKAE